VRSDHALDLSVSVATPPIRPHPACWLLKPPELNGSSETTRQTETYGTKRDETNRDIQNETRRYHSSKRERNETKLCETKQKE